MAFIVENDVMASKTSVSPSSGPGIIEIIKERIRDGSLPPGARLIESRIAAETGATRTHIREALHRLAGEGLVVVENFRGASVRQLTPNEVLQIFSTREVLEGLAARGAAGSPLQTRQAIATIQGAMNDCVDAGDAAGFAVANERWHHAIIAASANPYLQSFLERLWIPTFRLSFRRVYTPAIMQRSNLQHRLVTAAILAGQAEEADLAMRLHVKGGFSVPPSEEPSGKK
jgi:DNA-binding GntR family transcriptional regulator